MNFKSYFHIADNQESILRNIVDGSRKFLFDRIRRFVTSLGNKAFVFEDGKISGTDFSLNVSAKWSGQKVQVLVSSIGVKLETCINPLFFNSGNVKNYFKEIEIALKKEILTQMKSG